MCHESPTCVLLFSNCFPRCVALANKMRSKSGMSFSRFSYSTWAHADPIEMEVTPRRIHLLGLCHNVGRGQGQELGAKGRVITEPFPRQRMGFQWPCCHAFHA